jgi:hypothetical protein
VAQARAWVSTFGEVIAVKNGIRSLLFGAVAVAGLAMMSGCATKGAAFQQVESIPADKGLVYVYRPASFKGAAVSYGVKAKDTVITNLTNGGYYPYFADPGEIEIWAKTEAKSSVTLDVKAGQTYYVKGGIRIGALVGRPHLAVVPADVGAAEIAECKLIGSSP